MSYVIHLWESPIPGSLDEADETLKRLIDLGQVAPRASYQACVAQLLAQFPDDDVESVWIETPEAGGPVLTVGIVTGELTRVLPVVQAAARAQGLVVYDGQAGEVLLPSGIGYGTAGRFTVREESAAPPDEAPTPGTVGQRLREHLGPIFAKHGYKQATGGVWFQKTQGAGTISIRAETIRGRLKFSMLFAPKFPRAWKNLAERCKDSALRVDLERLATQYGLPFPAKPEESRVVISYVAQVDTWEKVDALGVALARLFEAGVLEFLDGLNSLDALDFWANRVPDEQCPFHSLRARSVENGLLLNYHVDLAIARAADNPAFETMAFMRVEQHTQGDAESRRLLKPLQAMLAACGLDSFA